MVDHSVVILIATCQSWSLIRDEREETVLFPFVSCLVSCRNRLHDANLPGGAREDVLKQGRVRGEGHELLELVLERRLHPNNPEAPDTRVVPSLGGILNLQRAAAHRRAGPVAARGRREHTPVRLSRSLVRLSSLLTLAGLEREPVVRLRVESGALADPAKIAAVLLAAALTDRSYGGAVLRVDELP